MRNPAKDYFSFLARLSLLCSRLVWVLKIDFAKWSKNYLNYEFDLISAVIPLENVQLKHNFNLFISLLSWHHRQQLYRNAVFLSWKSNKTLVLEQFFARFRSFLACRSSCVCSVRACAWLWTALPGIYYRTPSCLHGHFVPAITAYITRYSYNATVAMHTDYFKSLWVGGWLNSIVLDYQNPNLGSTQWYTAKVRNTFVWSPRIL